MPKPELRPPAGHESADVRVVALVNAGQPGAPDCTDLRIAMPLSCCLPSSLL